MEQMTVEELNKKQADEFTEMLGLLSAYLQMNIPMKVLDIKRKFKNINDKGLLPESLKHYIL